MTKNKRKTTIEHTMSQIKSHNDDDELKQLKPENKMLRIENEFLKNRCLGSQKVISQEVITLINGI